MGDTETTVRTLTLEARAADGVARSVGPVTFDGEFGQGSFGAEVNFGDPDAAEQIQLVGRAFLAPAFVNKASGKLLNPDAPVQVPIRVAGRFHKPATHAAIGKAAESLLLGKEKEKSIQQSTQIEQQTTQKAAEIQRQAAQH